jgi:hypothetical protein
MTDEKPAKKAAAAPRAKAKADVPVYAFPLPASHYFSVKVTARRSTSSGPYVAAIQRALGLKQTGTFDEELRTTVMGWQDEGKRPVTGTIDKDDWDALFNDL